MTVHVSMVAAIRALAADGYGYEDIAVKLKLHPGSVRRFVIGGEREQDQRHGGTKAAAVSVSDRRG